MKKSNIVLFVTIFFAGPILFLSAFAAMDSYGQKHMGFQPVAQQTVVPTSTVELPTPVPTDQFFEDGSYILANGTHGCTEWEQCDDRWSELQLAMKRDCAWLYEEHAKLYGAPSDWNAEAATIYRKAIELKSCPN